MGWQQGGSIISSAHPMVQLKWDASPKYFESPKKVHLIVIHLHLHRYLWSSEISWYETFTK